MRHRLGFLLIALAAALPVACDGGGGAPLSGVLIPLDTTRADALGCYGGDDATPNLDKLAEESVLFEGARTVTPVTLPSHASMLTGLYPPRHTVRTNGLTPLPASAVTLAERAQAAGFETAAFLSAVVLDPPFGLAQGFDLYDTPPAALRGTNVHMAERSDQVVARAAIRWLEERDDTRPFFLWVHFFDPHAPYDAPLRFQTFGLGTRAAYLAEVAAMDDALGEFIDALDRVHGLDDTLTIVVGDHGEALGAHGEETHSILVYEELLRVPLLVRAPGGKGGGTRVSDIVSVVDVFPTMLEGLGLGTPGRIDGVNLLSRPDDPTRGVYFESYDGYLNYGWSPMAGWMDAEGKYVHGTSPEFFDLRDDVRELSNLYTDEESVTPYRDALSALDALPPLEKDDEDTVDETHVAAIQSLGYAASGAAATRIPRLLENTQLPDSRSRLDELDALHAAVLDYQGAIQRKDQAGVDDALQRMAVIGDRNPQNAYANGALASFLYRQGRASEAMRRLLAVPEERRERSNLQDTLGHCYELLKSPEQALRHFVRALELRPGDSHGLQDIIRVLHSLGRGDEAEPFIRQLNRAR